MHADKVVLTGYLVRCPLGGYAWQILHYLIGLRDLGFDPYFYEDTAYSGDCFDPLSGHMHVGPDAGIAFAADFFERFGFARRWIFWDTPRNRYHGLGREEAAAVLQEARLVITLAAVNRLPRVPGQHRLFVDIDPAFTQIRAAEGDQALRQLLEEHDLHFTVGENIGTADCRVPTAGFTWRPTRPPVAVALWPALPAAATAPFTTIGRWDERRRDVAFESHVYSWSKRVEWRRFLDLPAHTGERFVLAMDVGKTAGDADLLRQRGWDIVDPIAVSSDALRYRDFIQHSKGEFTVAKGLNVRLASGWFSDRSACYLAAGRPVVTQGTGFDRCLPAGNGLFAVRTLQDAIVACRTIAADYAAQGRAARQLAETHFDAALVLRNLIAVI
jgi:hypothetical protein